MPPSGLLHQKQIPVMVDANSSEVLSTPATDDSIPSSTLLPPAQQAPAPHSSYTSGSIHPMVTRLRFVSVLGNPRKDSLLFITTIY